MRKYSLSLFWCLFVMLCTPIEGNTQIYDKAWLINKFNELDLAMYKGEGYSNFTNKDGVLSWAESYLLEAYLDMYETTGNMSYMQKFIAQANKVYSNTDIARGIKDYKGRSRTGWSATKYSKNKEPMIHVVHSGMILYPMIRFSVMVKNRSELSGYSDAAKKYTKLAEMAVADLEGQWRYVAKTGEGSYWFEGDEPMQANLRAPMPSNGPLALGRVIVLLNQMTGKESYLSKSKALAIYFRNNLTMTSEGGYVWGYLPKVTKHPFPEDISHGAIDVDFAYNAYIAGINFTQQDMQMFAKTIRHAFQNGKFSKFVDGTGDDPDNIYSDASGRWLELSAVDCGVYRIIYNYLINRTKKSTIEHPQILLGIAKLAKYWDKCGPVTN